MSSVLHWDACERGMMEKSAVVEHVWENHPPHQLGGDISAGQGQRTRETTAEGGPAHTDDTYRGAFQPVQRTGNPRLLDHIDVLRSNRHQPLTSNDVSSVVYGYKFWSFHTIFHFCPDEDWSIQSKHQQKLVSENSLFQISISYVQSLAIMWYTIKQPWKGLQSCPPSPWEAGKGKLHWKEPQNTEENGADCEGPANDEQPSCQLVGK